MVLTPNLDVPRRVDRFPRRPGLCVDVFDLLAGFGPDHGTVWRLKGDTVDLMQIVEGLRSQGWHQFFQGDFALADNHDVGARGEVLGNIGAGFRSSDDGSPA